MKNEKLTYDPIKIWNQRSFLNDVAIKCRFDMMYINRYYKEEGYTFKDNNLFINVTDPSCDKDITDFKHKIINDNVDDLIYRADLINSDILKSGVYDKIDSSDHTSLMNINLNIKNKSILKRNEKIKFLKDIQNEEKLFHRLYKNGSRERVAHLKARKISPQKEILEQNKKSPQKKFKYGIQKIEGRRSQILLPLFKFKVTKKEDFLHKLHLEIKK